jgi:hypothetical protein
MMGRLKSDQGQLFYEFHLGDAVSDDHLVRKIDTALDLSWVRGEPAPHYSSLVDRRSISGGCWRCHFYLEAARWRSQPRVR